MDGDIETRPLIHRDEPAERMVRLLGPVGREYDTDERQYVGERFEKIQASEPELIRRTGVGMDREAGRLAVGLLVYGDHVTLQRRAPEWLKVLCADDADNLGYAWSIGH